MEFVSGEILTKNVFQKGYIGFEKHRIIETGENKSPKKPVAKGLIIPSFVNAHTHIGDSFIKKRKIKLPRDVEKLVAPPNGLKHKLLKQATEKELIDSMESSIDCMIKSGISIFCDFREDGIVGICLLKTALDLWNISSFILSRPDDMTYCKNEIDILLNSSEGIGLSSISDWDYSELQKISKHVKKKKKLFALHASERMRENIDDILDLKPDFLVHMVKATEADLELVKDNNIPIVLCPRSNNFYGFLPDFELFKKVGINVLLGTDNAMLNSPNVLDEIFFVKKCCNVFSDLDLLNMVTYGPRKVLNLECDILGSNSKAEFVVLDKKTLKPLYVSL
jgi:cytosine/adenosine deaminase-related metal-dependent hydrolase